jgi:hypothetical protein
MRWTILLLASVVGTLPHGAMAQTQPLVRVAATHVPLPTFATVDYKLQCPSGYVPGSYSAIPQYPYDQNEDQSRLFVDRAGAIIDKGALSSGAQLDGAGYLVEVFNTEHHDKNLQALALCIATAASTDNTLQLVRASGTVAKLTQGTVTAYCPADSPVAFGGISNVDAVSMYDYGAGPVWGTSASPIVLGSLANGTSMGPPTGWQVRVYNAFSNAPVVAFALCGKAPTLRAYIYAVSAPGSAFGSPTPFSIFAPVPEGWTAVGMGYDGGNVANYLASDAWMDDGTVVSALQWYPASTSYNSGPAQVRAFMARGNGTSTGGPAAVAVLAVPSANPPPSPKTVTVTEFYNAALDHYFITANPDEIAKLDGGIFKGWARTGESFNAYGPGSSGRAGRRPVCREYGNPIYGLDSHFYSASPDECAASLVTTYGSWILEASEVFQMDLPDTAGNCPAGDVPVYRIWNKRRDSNHRYTTKTAIRDQMVAKGGIAEGYGPNAVALCGLP